MAKTITLARGGGVEQGSSERLSALKNAVANVVAAAVETPAHTTPAERRAAAFGGALEDPTWSAWVETVRDRSREISAADVDALRASGADDRRIFELALAAAVGAAYRRLRIGLQLLAPIR